MRIFKIRMGTPVRHSSFSSSSASLPISFSSYCCNIHISLALLLAAKNRHQDCVAALMKVSPWNVYNGQGLDFIHIALDSNMQKAPDALYTLVQDEVTAVLRDETNNYDAAVRWSARRWRDKLKSPAMDALMALTGLAKMKLQALRLYASVSVDKQRPLQAQITKSSMLHFAFVGNPGVGAFLRLE